jgi:hypothetical protein
MIAFFHVICLLFCNLLPESDFSVNGFPVERFHSFLKLNNIDNSFFPASNLPNLAKIKFCGKSRVKFTYQEDSEPFSDDWDFWAIQLESTVWLFAQLDNKNRLANLNTYITSHFKKSDQFKTFYESVGPNGKHSDIILIQIFDDLRTTGLTIIPKVNSINFNCESISIFKGDTEKSKISFPLNDKLLTKISTDCIAKKFVFRVSEKINSILVGFDYTLSLKNDRCVPVFVKAINKNEVSPNQLFQKSVFLFVPNAPPVKISLLEPDINFPTQPKTDTIGAFEEALKFAKLNKINQLVFISKSPEYTIKPENRDELPDYITKDLLGIQIFFIQLDGKEVASLKNCIKTGYCIVPFEHLAKWFLSLL